MPAERCYCNELGPLSLRSGDVCGYCERQLEAQPCQVCHALQTSGMGVLPCSVCDPTPAPWECGPSCRIRCPKWRIKK